MELTVGTILDGKVKSITNFGAFISLPEAKTGMVHISEIANTFVNDIREHLTEGQDVKVMVIAVDPAGRVNLSIKKALPTPSDNAAGRKMPQERRGQAPREYNNRGQRRTDRGGTASAQPQKNQRANSSNDTLSFEEKLKQFMSESDSKMASIRQYSDRKTKTRRR